MGQWRKRKPNGHYDNRNTTKVTENGNTYVNVDVYFDADYKAKVRSNADLDQEDVSEKDKEKDKKHKYY
ncbi:putative alkaline shock family protein YloU [Virgibacillus natechei]|uniref:Alkaline shock family protein YloU n=1 Tax=Virgibacillus natechei TaxID=1216297 RepID=A0ABS4IEM2_9BACI|nr:hypothetical protein [Virgibacillus natechei]MBP1969065.1 putative alkaline shock family protein YloU [Virgibacillus natechei]UZD14335.1 hypothetical protein OLD84_07475 [Virgibacillus natechei]